MDTGDRDWPMLVLQSGRCLCIATDNEGNGPGAIHEVTACRLRPIVANYRLAIDLASTRSP